MSKQTTIKLSKGFDFQSELSSFDLFVDGQKFDTIGDNEREKLIMVPAGSHSVYVSIDRDEWGHYRSETVELDFSSDEIKNLECGHVSTSDGLPRFKALLLVVPGLFIWQFVYSVFPVLDLMKKVLLVGAAVMITILFGYPIFKACTTKTEPLYIKEIKR